MIMREVSTSLIETPGWVITAFCIIVGGFCMKEFGFAFRYMISEGVGVMVSRNLMANILWVASLCW